MSKEIRLQNTINKFRKEHRNLIQMFVDEKRANQINISSIISKLCVLKKVMNEIDISLREMAEEKNKEKAKQITNKIFSNEKLTFSHRKMYKQFFRWVNDGDTPAFLKHFSCKKTFRELKPGRKGLTPEQVKAIIDNCETQRDRTIFTMMGEIPLRPIEITRIRMKHVNSDEYGYTIELHGKTAKGHRRIRFIHSTPEIRAYLAALPETYKKDLEKPLFYSYSDRNKGDPISQLAMHFVLKASLKKASLRHDIQLYDFRRFSATCLLLNPNYGIADVKQLGGWSSLEIVNTYNKTTDDQVNDKRLVINGLTEKKNMAQENILKGLECPRCKALNQRSADLCVSCWQPLTETAINDTMNRLFDKESVKNIIKKELIEDIKKELKMELGLK